MPRSGMLTGAPRSRAGSRPRTDASMERRRRWAASGRLPPGLAARFTLAEQAVLAVVAVEVRSAGDCRLAVGTSRRIAGVSETTVRNASGRPGSSGSSRSRNGASPASATTPTWSASCRGSGRPGCGLPDPVKRLRGGGVKSVTGTNTHVPYSVNSEGWRGQKGFRGRRVALSSEPHRRPARRVEATEPSGEEVRMDGSSNDAIAQRVSPAKVSEVQRLGSTVTARARYAQMFTKLIPK